MIFKLNTKIQELKQKNFEEHKLQMPKGKYIYESHMGGYYTRDYEIDPNDLIDEESGDEDFCLGFAKNKKEAAILIKNDTYSDGYEGSYIKEFLNENF